MEQQPPLEPPKNTGIPTTPIRPTNPIQPNLNQEKIVAPFNLKRVGVFFVNIILFMIYNILASFSVGLIGGMLEPFIGTEFIRSNSFNTIGASIGFILAIIITLIFRKKIYLKVVKI